MAENELLSPFEKMKLQVAKHESVIILRASIVLINHDLNGPLSVETLFAKVKKHINITCVDIFRNVIRSKDKLFGSQEHQQELELPLPLKRLNMAPNL